MCTLMQIEDEYEAREPSTMVDTFECAVCWCCFPGNYHGWRIPHPVAKELNLGDDDSCCWVCSSTCQIKFCDTYFDEIQEYEEFQEEEA